MQVQTEVKTEKETTEFDKFPQKAKHLGQQNRTRSAYRWASIPLSKDSKSQRINSFIIFFRQDATNDRSNRSLQSVSILCKQYLSTVPPDSDLHHPIDF